MKHDLYAEGYGLRLRPVRLEDAGFILWLRHRDYVKGKLGDTPDEVCGQEAWLREYFERAGDYYFIIETLAEIPIGTFGLYNLAGTVAESGRWIIRPQVMAAVPSALLACVVAFERLGLSHVYSRVVSTNQAVLSLDQRLGFHMTRIELAALVIDNQPVDLVHLVYPAPDWPANHERLLPAALASERRIRRWEEIQLQAEAQAARRPELSIAAAVAD